MRLQLSHDKYHYCCSCCCCCHCYEHNCFCCCYHCGHSQRHQSQFTLLTSVRNRSPEKCRQPEQNAERPFRTLQCLQGSRPSGQQSPSAPRLMTGCLLSMSHAAPASHARVHGKGEYQALCISTARMMRSTFAHVIVSTVLQLADCCCRHVVDLLLQLVVSILPLLIERHALHI